MMDDHWAVLPICDEMARFGDYDLFLVFTSRLGTSHGTL